MLMRTPQRTARSALQRLRDVTGRDRSSRAPGGPVGNEPGSGGSLKVASYNVHKCVGRDGRFDPGRIAAVIGEMDADLVAVQEADRRFGRRYGLLDAATLQRESGLTLLGVSDLPDGHGWHGNALLVRHPPGQAPRLHLRRLALPGAEPRGAVIAELQLPAGKLRVVAAHFGLLRRCRVRQAATILRAITEGEPMPTLMMGDLNEWRPGPRSSLRALEHVFGPLSASPPSFPARRPLLALDRILGWPQGILGEVAAHDTPLARLASDHLPLTARVDLAAAAGAELGGRALAAAA
ncbi:endonuclease/exonuclease/phosphatase family protein [Roseomonas sp. OT10]|uniref:endonuclease/exonuclease/phosphatase family protein n=1 Tax=Roseomonas cutis TaxID=2897332 RepID=UPI001E3B8C18|nr:endonuclease/exonuclease/phosphatase family protein [Roseomonas sp. OT10]UFN50900.1 endonuclease/exonuclease/phosphatase family protein [Roseomonas sp. OT10]